MATLKLSLSLSKRDTATLVAMVEGSRPSALIQRVADLVLNFNTGSERPGTFISRVEENGTQATGTCTFASIQANDTFTINGTTFTCVASGATGNQFNVGASDTQAAANAAAAVNASATAIVNQAVTASAASGVVTFTSIEYSFTGNWITLASSNNTRAAVSGARLTGGVKDTGTTISK